jgi:hypothetical protein
MGNSKGCLAAQSIRRGDYRRACIERTTPSGVAVRCNNCKVPRCKPPSSAAPVGGPQSRRPQAGASPKPVPPQGGASPRRCLLKAVPPQAVPPSSVPPYPALPPRVETASAGGPGCAPVNCDFGPRAMPCRVAIRSPKPRVAGALRFHCRFRSAKLSRLVCAWSPLCRKKFRT